jgi:hypothetical protein
VWNISWCLRTRTFLQLTLEPARYVCNCCRSSSSSNNIINDDDNIVTFISTAPLFADRTLSFTPETQVGGQSEALLQSKHLVRWAKQYTDHSSCSVGGNRIDVRF